MNIIVLQEKILPGLDKHHNERISRGAQGAVNARMDEYALMPLDGYSETNAHPATVGDLRGMAWHVT